MKIIRKVLGFIIIAIDKISRPRPMQRSSEQQKIVDHECKKYSLYQFNTCPFCVKVRRMIHKLNLKIDLKDALQPDIEKELIEGAGKRKVPCLRIQHPDRVEWMYESSDINAYLEKIFATAA